MDRPRVRTHRCRAGWLRICRSSGSHARRCTPCYTHLLCLTFCLHCTLPATLHFSCTCHTHCCTFARTSRTFCTATHSHTHTGLPHSHLLCMLHTALHCALTSLPLPFTAPASPLSACCLDMFALLSCLMDLLFAAALLSHLCLLPAPLPPLPATWDSHCHTYPLPHCTPTTPHCLLHWKFSPRTHTAPLHTAHTATHWDQTGHAALSHHSLHHHAAPPTHHSPQCLSHTHTHGCPPGTTTAHCTHLHTYLSQCHTLPLCTYHHRSQWVIQVTHTLPDRPACALHARTRTLPHCTAATPPHLAPLHARTSALHTLPPHALCLHASSALPAPPHRLHAHSHCSGYHLSFAALFLLPHAPHTHHLPACHLPAPHCTLLLPRHCLACHLPHTHRTAHWDYLRTRLTCAHAPHYAPLPGHCTALPGMPPHTCSHMPALLHIAPAAPTFLHPLPHCLTLGCFLDLALHCHCCRISSHFLLRLALAHLLPGSLEVLTARTHSPAALRTHRLTALFCHWAFPAHFLCLTASLYAFLSS